MLCLSSFVLSLQFNLITSTTSVESLFKIISARAPDAFVFQFHSPNFDFRFIQICYPCRLLMFAPNYKAQVPQATLVSRYTQPSHLIFSHYNPRRLSALFRLTHYQIKILTTIYLHYLEEQHELIPVLRNFAQFRLPTITVIIEWTQQGTELLVDAYYILEEVGCGRRNCANSLKFVGDNAFLNFVSPGAFHRTYFRKGGGRHAYALPKVRPEYFFYSNKFKNPYFCSSFVGTARNNKIAAMCNYQIMAVIELSRVHNISFHVTKRVDSEGEVLDTHVGVKAFNNQFYGGSAATYVLYCKTTKLEDAVSYQVWTDAFAWTTWLLIGSVILVCAAAFSGTKVLSLN